jgi:hypothetical protein
MPIAQHHFVPPWPKQQRYSRTSIFVRKTASQFLVKDNLADLFTKILSIEEFQRLRDRIIFFLFSIARSFY